MKKIILIIAVSLIIGVLLLAQGCAPKAYRDTYTYLEHKPNLK